MTLCMAVICQEDWHPRIVICLDSRLDEVYASTDKANKLDSMGHDWFSLLSGEWISAKELSRFISTRFTKSPRPVCREDAFALVAESTMGFRSSPFYVQNCQMELIVGGFIANEPTLIYTGYRDDTPVTQLADEIAMIGAGEQIARAMLRIRKYSASVPVRQAIYLSYEAKKYSESAPSVGPKTGIAVLYPNGSAKSLRRNHYRELEENRLRFGLQPINPMELSDPLSTQSDASPRQPSPDLPAKSDES